MPMNGSNLQDFKEFIRDKRVLLVGNNLTALERKQGSMIDSYDVVVRFGKGIMPGYEEFIGSKTDVWMTGEFRKAMRHLAPEDAWVLYNPSYLKKAEPPEYDHIIMFEPKEAKKINDQYKVDGSRLSAGAYTAWYFKNKVDTYKELHFINFDFFTQTAKFTDSYNSIQSYANSWHLPLMKEKDIPEDPLHNPVHNPEAEKAVFDSIQDGRVRFIGLSYQRPTYITLTNAAWDRVRKPAK